MFAQEMPMPYQFEYNTDDGYGNKQDRHEKGLISLSLVAISYVNV